MVDEVKTLRGVSRQAGYDYVPVPGQPDTYMLVAQTNLGTEIQDPTTPSRKLARVKRDLVRTGIDLPASLLGNLPPINSVLPVITGIAQVGQTLSASQGTWSNSPTSYAYQWSRNGAVISGATSSTYTPVSADVGATLTVTVAAINLIGLSTATSLATSAVISAGPPLSISGTPGQATVGSAYSFSPTVAGGFGTRTFSLSGSLPPGLSFSSATGAISGTPTTVGTTTGLGISVADDSASVSLTGLSIVVKAMAVLAKTLGAATASGVSFAQLPAGTSFTTPGSAPASYFSISAGGLVSTNDAFVSAALGSTTLDVALTNAGDTTTLRVSVVAGQVDVDTAARLTIVVNAVTASNDNVAWLTDTFVDGAAFSTTRVFNGSISHPNQGKTVADSINTPSSISPTAVPTMSGGSMTIMARTPNAPRFNNKITLQGCGPLAMDGIAARLAPTQDVYNAKFNEVTQSVLWKPAVSAAKTSTVTISQASPAVITWTGHGLARDWPVTFTTTGTLPTGITAGTTYYVDTVPSADTLTLRTTGSGGTGVPVNTTATGSGTHTANVAAGAVVGVASFDRTGIGYLANTAERRVYIATKAAGPGSNFSGWFDANNDGTIDTNSQLYVINGGGAYDSTSQFRQPTLQETTQLQTCQSNTSAATSTVQIQISANGTVLPKVILRNGSSGNPGGSINRIAHCIDVRNGEQVYVHDWKLERYWLAIQVWQGNDVEFSRIFSIGNANDFYRQYPSLSPVGSQATTGVNARVLNCVCVEPLAVVDHSNEHADAKQCLAPQDVNVKSSIIFRFNRIFWPGNIRNHQTQAVLDTQGPYPLYQDCSDNFFMTSTQNAQWGSCQDPALCHADRNTYFRYMENNPTENEFSPGYPACFEPWFNHKGTWSSTANYNYGDVVSDGASTPTYYSSKLATTNNNRALTDTTYWLPYPKYDITMNNNIVGAIWASPPTATGNDRSKLTMTNGTVSVQMYNYRAAGNAFISNYTANTGNGDSMPEVLAGGTSFFDTFVQDVGWTGFKNKIPTTGYAEAKAAIDAAFATKPSGHQAVGKGYLQAA